MNDELHLHHSEVLGFAAVLYHEIGGIELGSFSPSRILNRRTGRDLTPAEWYALLEPHYIRMIDPAAADNTARRVTRTRLGPDPERTHSEEAPVPQGPAPAE